MHLAKPEASSGLELGEKGQVDVSFGFIKISTIYLNDKIMIANKKHFRLSFLKAHARRRNAAISPLATRGRLRSQ